MLRAGQLRHPVMVQANTPTQDAGGEWGAAWADVGLAWADIDDVRGQESRLAMENQGYVTHKIKIRPFAGLTIKHRILWGSRVLNISHIDDTEPDFWWLDAMEVVGREGM
ncbi:phage head closure protein [Megalodesulfovibrio gigas]|uniref:Putative phage head-tail adaptor n=1 Tax=Megalodesulfovibrio gigas (strain ATCC 19364 / DSM 1382 / NCIMB 9332 / VKM B-1759) TaxID=1121448 RepID=T2GD24_MEGG1|nr:phage head closure protein [Megalodesulfovibrio gigas]AGW13817.1 putative phage head-tail adaptor [Megalodesulfovibrio gigas DSM 1382 = ATCC 19364]